MEMVNGVILSPNVRLAWSVACALLVTGIVAGDWVAREQGWDSFLAPTAGSLWWGVALGGLGGAAGWVLERLLMTRHRAHQLAFHRASILERVWRQHWDNLWQCGWFVLLVLGLLVWCVWAEVLAIPPLLAANAVQFAGNRRLIARFRAELLHDPAAEPRAAADRGLDSV